MSGVEERGAYLRIVYYSNLDSVARALENSAIPPYSIALVVNQTLPYQEWYLEFLRLRLIARKENVILLDNIQRLNAYFIRFDRKPDVIFWGEDEV